MKFQEAKNKYLNLDYNKLSSEDRWILHDVLKSVQKDELCTRQDHEDYLQLLNHFRMVIAKDDQLHGENYKQRITSMLSTGEDGVYVNSLRYIFELIQNVDDCEFDDPSNCTLKIQFNEWHERIVLYYNETGFTPFNVFAITGIAEAAKNVQNGNVQIGEKGIGFKSVFGVAKRVWIQSGKFSFELDQDDFFVPIPVYDDRYEEIQGTKLTLFVDAANVKKTYQKICSTYCKPKSVFQNNPILFLNKLTELQFYIDEFDSLTFSVSKRPPHSSNNELFERNVTLRAILKSRRSHNIDNCIHCVRYTQPIRFNRAQCVARYGANTQLTQISLKIQLLLPIEEDLNKIEQGAFYSYLPTEIRLNVPVACHVPFKLDASREYVDSQNNNLWFSHCCKELSTFLKKIYYDFSHTVGNQVSYYVPEQSKPFFAQTNEKTFCLDRPELNGSTFIQEPIFRSLQNNFCPANVLCFFQTPTPVVDPLLVNRLLGLYQEVFIYPGTLYKSFGMKKIDHIGERLFQRAFEINAPTGEILCYLDEQHLLQNDKWKELADGLAGRTLTLQQIQAVLQHRSCMTAFKEKTTDRNNHISPSGVRVQFSASDAQNVLQVDPSGEDFNLDNFPVALQNYFNHVHFQCILFEAQNADFFLADNVLILSGDILSALSELCNCVEKQNLFALQLRYREVSRQLNDVNNSMPDQEYLSLLRSLRDSQRQTLGHQQYKTYISILKDSSVSDDRFLSEILQNADDCHYPENATPEFILSISQKKITTQYNECGFTKENVRSITAIGESTKRKLNGENVIGEKGVGFKSVFSFAHKVEIHSGFFHFSLTRERPTIPERITSVQDKPTAGTRMVFSLDKSLPLKLLSPQNIIQLCLCLRQLKHIQIGDIDIRIQDTPEQRTITLNGKEYTYRIIRHSFVVNDDSLIAERENHQRIISNKQEIVFYLPDKKSSEWHIYSGLPTTVKLNVPMQIDAPFELTTSRDLILENRWNEMVWNQLFIGLRSMLEILGQKMQIHSLKYLNFKYKQNSTMVDVSFDLFETTEYNKKLKNSVSFWQSAKIIPTFDPQCPLVAVSSKPVLYPSIAQEVLYQGYHSQRNRNNIVNTQKSGSFDTTLKSLGCKDAPLEEVVIFLTEFGAENMDEEFAVKYWKYLSEQSPKMTESIRNILRQYAIIPVLGETPSSTDFIKLNDNIFIDPTAKVSPTGYEVLNTKLLSKRAFEEIFDININQMDDVYRKSIYQKEIKRHIQQDSIESLYAYLLRECNTNSHFKDWGIRELPPDIPLKNEIGEIKCSKIYLDDQPTGYFGGTIIPRSRCAQECKALAHLIQRKSLKEVRFEDLDICAPLSADDIESLQDEYFNHGANILEECVEHGLISEELIATYELRGLQPQEFEANFDDFPCEPVSNLRRLQNQITNAPFCKIQKKDCPRTVDYIDLGNGKIEQLNATNSQSRISIIKRYTPKGKKYCFCQMCLRGKPANLIEVNNLESAPSYYWQPMRIALCLDCSKIFEDLRRNKFYHDRFLQSLRQANCMGNIPVEVPIGNKTITFTQTHLAEIQAILEKIHFARS